METGTNKKPEHPKKKNHNMLAAINNHQLSSSRLVLKDQANLFKVTFSKGLIFHTHVSADPWYIIGYVFFSLPPLSKSLKIQCTKMDILKCHHSYK